MFIPLVVIGTADTGPDSILTTPSSIIDAQNTFGWYQKEYYTIQGLQTSGSTRYPIWGNLIDVYKNIDGYLNIDVLYNLNVQASGTYVTFGCPGASGVYLFKYVRCPSYDNIIWAADTITSQNAAMPTLYKIPGTKPTVTIGDLVLSTQYTGEKYNGIEVTVSGGLLTIYFMGTYYTSGSVSYSTSMPGNLLVNQINMDNYTRKHPLTATCLTMTPNLPVGTYYTTGGTNGTLTPDAVVTALSTMDLGTIGMILLAGSPSTGTVTAALNYIESLNEDFPACLISSCPDSMITATSTGMYNFLTSLNYSSNKLFYVPGWGTSYTSIVNTTLIPLSHIFAALWSLYSSPPTNKVSSLDSVIPIWNPDQIHALGNNYCVFNKYIISGYAPWRSCPTNGENPLITKVKSDIAARIENSIGDIVGNPAIQPSVLFRRLQTALDGIENVQEINYTCEVGSEYVSITITVVIFGELEAIQMNIVSTRDSKSLQ
jgi:hypothetical protein